MAYLKIILEILSTSKKFLDFICKYLKNKKRVKEIKEVREFEKEVKERSKMAHKMTLTTLIKNFVFNFYSYSESIKILLLDGIQLL